MTGLGQDSVGSKGGCTDNCFFKLRRLPLDSRRNLFERHGVTTNLPPLALKKVTYLLLTKHVRFVVLDENIANFPTIQACSEHRT